MAWFGTKFEKNCWRTAPGLSAYSSQQQQKAERQQKSSRVQFCSNLVPNHFTGLSLAPRSLCIRWFWNIFSNQKLSVTITARPRDTRNLVPEKNRAAQNRASWGLYLCTKWDFFPKNSVSARFLAKIRVISRLLLCGTVYSVKVHTSQLRLTTKVQH